MQNTATSTSIEKHCGQCVHFRNDPAWLEQALPGFNVMSSAYASVRQQDGICALHEVMCNTKQSCASFEKGVVE